MIYEYLTLIVTIAELSLISGAFIYSSKLENAWKTPLPDKDWEAPKAERHRLDKNRLLCLFAGVGCWFLGTLIAGVSEQHWLHGHLRAAAVITLLVTMWVGIFRCMVHNNRDSKRRTAEDDARSFQSFNR